MRSVSVLVYSDQRMFGTSLADSLDDEVHHVRAVVERADDLRVEARRAEPDVCVMDVEVGDRAVDMLFEVVRSECPETRIMVLTSSVDASLWQAYDAGLVDAVISKIHGLDTFRTSIDRVALGERFALASARPSAPPRSAEWRLTAREHEILLLLERGATTHQMMTAMTISPSTLRTHVQHVLNKLHAHTRAQAVQAALTERILVGRDEVVS